LRFVVFFVAFFAIVFFLLFTYPLDILFVFIK